MLVIGGGVAGTQAAAELAQMGHPVELVERRPFLGGRATRIGTVFPTNDCGQCLPTTDAQSGTRKCLYRNVAIDNPNLRIWRRTTVESVTRQSRRLRGLAAPPAQDRHRRLHRLRALRVRLRGRGPEGSGKAIYAEFYDGRVRARSISRPARSAAPAPRCAPSTPSTSRQSPELTTVRAGAILMAIGCEPAPAALIDHLGYGRHGVVTQIELAEMMDGWEEQSWRGRMPAATW